MSDAGQGSPPLGSEEAMDCDGVEEPSGGGAADGAWGHEGSDQDQELEREFPDLLSEALVLKTHGFPAVRAPAPA